MAEINGRVGDQGDVVVEMLDANGNVTDDWDSAGGVQWTSTLPSAFNVTDADANPKDAVIDFLALTAAGEEGFIECSFDGRVGPGERRITARSVSLAVVPGEATGARVQVTMRPVA
jgi:hypothetical protein